MTVPRDDRRPVFLVSGGTGNTARSVLQAALRQFGKVEAYTRTFHHVGAGDLERVFREAQAVGALVIWTLVRPETRLRATALAVEMNLPHVDVLGPILDTLGHVLQQAPRGVPGLLHRADERYYSRIAAIEYTLHLDDGRNPHHLDDADVVILGVSRTGKTPLSTYLAHQGFKVANQPVVLDQPIPPEIFDLDQRRIFALTIDPESLQRIRRSRMRMMRMPEGTNYSDLGYILAELEYANKLYKGNRWPIIDVTTRAIEESAGVILSHLEDHGLLDADGRPVAAAPA